MATKTNTTETAEEATLRVTVRILKNGVHAGHLILGKGAVVTLPKPEAAALVAAGSAASLS